MMLRDTSFDTVNPPVIHHSKESFQIKPQQVVIRIRKEGVFDVHIKDHINQITADSDSIDGKVKNLSNETNIDISNLNVAACLLSLWCSQKSKSQ